MGLNSRTRYYVHKRTCPFKPKQPEAKDGGEGEGGDMHNERRNDERNNVEQSSGSPDGSPQLKQPRTVRQRSSEPASKSAVPRPPMHRSQTEPTASAAAAAAAASEEKEENDDDQDESYAPSGARRFSPESLICKVG